MIMKARQDGDVVIFELEGHLDFETTLQFRDTCASLLKRNSTVRIIFNLQKLKFVGSSGINQFIRVLKQFNASKEKPKICNLSSEFLRVFRAYQASRNPFQIFEDEIQALASFDAPEEPKRISRRKVMNN